MALTVCKECGGKVSDKAHACPSCGHPLAEQNGANIWARVLGGTAGTYISAQALVTIIVAIAAFTSFAAIMIAAILR